MVVTWNSLLCCIQQNSDLSIFAGFLIVVCLLPLCCLPRDWISMKLFAIKADKFSCENKNENHSLGLIFLGDDLFMFTTSSTSLSAAFFPFN